MPGNGALDFHPSMQCMLVSCKCNHFCPSPPLFFLVFIFSAPHTVLESENFSAGMVSLAFFLFLPSSRDPSISGEPGSVVPCE